MLMHVHKAGGPENVLAVRVLKPFADFVITVRQVPWTLTLQRAQQRLEHEHQPRCGATGACQPGHRVRWRGEKGRFHMRGGVG